MAIRYDQDLSREIRRTVKNFNAKITRYEKKGYTGLPRRLRTADIKANFNDRRSLKRELKFFQKFSNKDSLTSVLFDGQTVYKWNVEYFKRNYRKSENYYNEKKENVKKYVTNRPVGRKTRLKKADVALKLLRGKNGRYKSTFATRQNIMYNYLQRTTRTKRFRNQFYISLKSSASLIGFDDSQINRVIRNLRKLNDTEFEALYENEDLITRIFQMHPSDGEMWRIFGGDADDLITLLAEKAEGYVELYSQ